MVEIGVGLNRLSQASICLNKALLNLLPTKARLLQHLIQVHPTCGLCGSENKNISRLFSDANSQLTFGNGARLNLCG